MINNTGIFSVNPAVPTPSAPAQGPGAAEMSEKFSTYLNEAFQNLDGLQKQTDALSAQFAAGQLSDVHQLMIASEQASLGLSFTVQVRNKVIEAYQEIMRIRV